MIYRNTGLVLGAAFAALSLSACATKDDITAQVAPVSEMANATAAATAANAADIAATKSQMQGDLAGVHTQLTAQDQRLAGLDATTKQAMMRADAAGKLAEGKFLYSVVLSDDGIVFPQGGAKLTPEAQSRLAGLVEKLKTDNKAVYLEIQGYTDNTGSPATNNRLATERADAVRKYLSQQGVPLSRMSTIAYGEDNPVAPNKTKAGRAQNRRVVVVVLT